jgi:hypothetical protein
VAKQQAEMQKLAGEAEGLVRQHSAEMQWFELMQGVINKEAQAAFELLNIQVNENTKEYLERFTDLNAQIALTESESLGVLADINVSNIKKDKWREMRNAVLKVGDVNRSGEAQEASLIAQAASSNLDVSDASTASAISSLNMETDRNASREIMASGDNLSALSVSERQQEVEGIRARALGRIRVEEIRKQGAEGEFELEQRNIQGRTQVSSLASDAENLRTSAELVKVSGIASANAAIASGAAQSKASLTSAMFGSLNTLTSGLSNTYQTYLTRQATRTPAVTSATGSNGFVTNAPRAPANSSAVATQTQIANSI